MTKPTERVNAVNMARELLIKLSTPGERIPLALLRSTCRMVLKHYPTRLDMEDPVRAFIAFR